MANNEFLVSVANVVLRDPTTLEGLAYGKANISSAFSISMQKTEVRGGINNPLVYSYYHDRMVEINIEQAIFTETVVALNAGATIQSAAVTVLKTECLVLSASGSGTCTETPTGNVSVFLPSGTIEFVTPTGSDFTTSGGADLRVDVVYPYSKASDRITVDAFTPPSVVDLTLLAEVRDNTGAVTYYLQVHVPRFQVSGNYTMTLSANGVSTQALEGTALVSAATDCSGSDYYATVTWIPSAATTIAINAIAATPGTMEFTEASLPSNQTITTLGIRGGLYTNLNITTSCSYAMAAGGSAAFSVGANTGVVTAGSSGSAGHAATVDVTYYDPTSGSLVDTVDVSIIA